MSVRAVSMRGALVTMRLLLASGKLTGRLKKGDLMGQ
jgi:hypothetical protein